MLTQRLWPLLAILGLQVLANSERFHDLGIQHEIRDFENSPWEKQSRVPDSFNLHVRIGLTQRNLDAGHDLLMKIADPESSSYGEHLTEKEVLDFFAPSKLAIDAVYAWLASAGVGNQRVQLALSKQWVGFDATSAELERLLDTSYHFYSHSGGSTVGVGCDEYYLPAHLAEHIDFVTPGVAIDVLMSKRPSLKKLALGSSKIGRFREFKQASDRCDKDITPDCIYKLYNISSGYRYKSFPGNEIGIFETGQTFFQGNLDSFFREFRPDIPNGTHPKIHSIDGGKVRGPYKTRVSPKNMKKYDRVFSDAAEVSLDTEIAYGLLNPEDIVLFPSDDRKRTVYGKYRGLFNNFLDGIDASYCNETAFGETGDAKGIDEPYPDLRKGGYKGHLNCGRWKPTNVISISYGPSESFYPLSYIRRQCGEYMKLALRGITTVSSSGDSGVAEYDSACLGKGKRNSTVFAATTPATCPYVLAVGAVYLPPGASAGKDREVATTQFASGGGFSNIFPRQQYQRENVEHFFKYHDPPYRYYKSHLNESFGDNDGVYNRIGRAFPDVSAVAEKIYIYLVGAAGPYGAGTSASAPIWASILTRVNAARLNAGKPTVGFVHPALYKNPHVFHDITKGRNPGCGTEGFEATEGWDPVTGLGTPDFPKLMDLFMSLK